MAEDAVGRRPTRPRRPTLSRRAALRWLAAFTGLLVVGGRAAAQTTDPEPRGVAIGDDRCPACGMAVVDARFAAQARTEGGRTLVYDAIECLADHLNGHAGPVPVVSAAWLADRVASTQAASVWWPAEVATLLHHPRLRTPMGGGLAAFGDEPEALAFAEAQRLAEPSVLTWDEVLELGIPRPWVPLV
ncbi:MAG: nitrous oxide reductase accessory protein NosL [Trueperaceae bacterium]